MTVKCLTEEQKIHVAFAYNVHLTSCEELANRFDVSIRTIQRVLVEEGVNRARVRRTKSEGVTTAPAPVKSEPVLHIDMIELTFVEKVQCMLKAIFWRTPKQTNAQTRK
jgi:transposase